MHVRDRVKQLAARGKTPGDLHARLCDVATAVEILAGELKAVPESAQTFIGALDTLSAAPQPSLVERLKKAYVFAEMEAIAGGGDPVDMGVRAILASLSKTPVAMMTADHIATLCGGEDYSPTDRRYARSAVQAFQEFVAPILAANDARIQELESLHAESPAQTFDQLGGFGFDRGPEPVAEMAVHVPSTVPPRFVPENYYAMTESEIMPPVDSDESLPVAHTAEFAPQDGDANTGKWILRADVLNAIDAQVSAANVVAGERLETIELQRKRTVDLEAQIAGLERDRRHCVDAITESNLVPPGRTLLEGIGEFVRLHDHAKTRIAALETRVAAVTRQRDDEHGLSNLRSYEIDTWKKELADARARIAELEASGAATAEGLQAALSLAKRDYMAAQTALDNVKDKLQRTEQDLGAKTDRVAELEKRLARDAFCDVPARIALLKADHAPLVDGKTPGTIARNAYALRLHDVGADDTAATWEAVALAVLCAFGQPEQTPPTNVADAPRRAMARFVETSRGASPVEVVRLHRIIDDELATLEATPPSDAATPKFFATENELRGSYFCTEFPFLPYLHVGRDIEFDDIPRLLKLGRNDVIEVRVVQRAKP